MFSRLLLLFVIVPAVELYLLIQIGEVIGFSRTVLLILTTGMLGSYMAKTQGLKVWNSFQAALTSGKLPGTQILDGVIILISGAFLVTPGVITDVVGLLGLLPLTRSVIRKIISERINVSQIHATTSFGAGATHTGAFYSSANPASSGSETSGQPTPHPAASDQSAFDHSAPDSSGDPDVSVGGTARQHPGYQDRDS